MTTTSTPPAITVEGLRVSYRATVAVDDVSFTVAPGEILGVLSPNGAGRTTTVETLTGLRRADRGHLDVLGHDSLTLVLTISALLGLGLFVAAVTPTSKVAGAVGTVLFFPLMVGVGLWVPRASMPTTVRAICDWSPLGAANRPMSTTLAGHVPPALASWHSPPTRSCSGCSRSTCSGGPDPPRIRGWSVRQ